MQALKEAIIHTANYYGRTLSAQVLSMYVEDLEDLPVAQVLNAYKEYRRNPKNVHFPLPAQIRGMVQPQVDPESAAREVAARINGAVVKFGWANPSKAKAYIGDVGWSVIERRGGWMHLCENLGVTIDPTAFEAQVREQAKASLKYGDTALGVAISAGSNRGELESASKIMSRLLNGRPEGETHEW